MRKPLLLLSLAAWLPAFPIPADSPERWVKAHSPFKDFTIQQVAHGEILESRAGASESPEVEAVQTCFIIKAAPGTVAAKILSWNPAGKSGLEVSKHTKLASSGPDAFAGALATFFKSSGGQANWLAEQSKKAKDPSCELILTASEKDLLAAATTTSKLSDAWATILAHRLGSFHGQGASDFHNLLSTLQKVGAGDIPEPPGDAGFYWEISEVGNRGILAEGATWQDAGGGPARVFDGEFFVTSEYSASLNANTLGPVTVDGKPATLVWRIDSAFTHQFADQNGAERIAAAGLILSSAKKAIQAMRQELEK